MKTFEPGMVANACNPSSRWRQQGQRFKVSLGFMSPCIKNQNKTELQKAPLLCSFLPVSLLFPSLPSSLSSPFLSSSPYIFPFTETRVLYAKTRNKSSATQPLLCKVKPKRLYFHRRSRYDSVNSYEALLVGQHHAKVGNHFKSSVICGLEKGLRG